MNRYRILLADDHTVVLEGLRRMLDRPEFEVVGAVHDGRALIDSAAHLRPDVIVADISMPTLNGVDAARRIRKDNPKIKIIFLTMHPEPAYAIQAMSTGASGYLLKNDAGEELVTAIHNVLQGRTYVTKPLAEPVMKALLFHSSPKEADDPLTSRQRQVLQLLAEGKQPKEIAAVLSVSYRTVEFHKYRIMETLGVKTVAELAATRSGTELSRNRHPTTPEPRSFPSSGFPDMPVAWFNDS